MDRYWAYARVLATGGPLGGASVTIYDAGTFNLSLIYDDDLPTPTAKANPFIADGNGYFFFYAVAGRYDIRIEAGSIAHDPYTWGDVVVGEVHASEHVLATSTALGPEHTVSGLTTGHVLTAVTATTARFEELPAAANDDHGVMEGLLDDDHPQFALLAGRFGGQDLFGGNVSGQALSLRGSTGTGGPVLINPEALGNVGVHVLSAPTHPLTVNGKIQSESGGYVFPDGTLQITAAGAGDPTLWTLVGLNVYNVNNGFVSIGAVDPRGSSTRGVPVRRLQVESANIYSLRLVQTRPPTASGLELCGNSTLWGMLRASAAGLKLTTGGGCGPWVDPTGQIGIGTELPLNTLHVRDLAADSGTGGDNDQVQVESVVGYRAGVGLWQSTTFLGDFAGDPTRIGIFVGDLGKGVAQGLGIALDRGTERAGVGLAAGDPTQAKLHVKGKTTDPVMLRLETADLLVNPEVIADFYTSTERVGRIVADETYLRLANGLDAGCLKMSQSTGFVVISHPEGFDSGAGVMIGVDPARRLSVVGASGEDFQLSLQSPSAGGLELRTPTGVVGALRASDTSVELSSMNGVVLYIDQSNDTVGIGTTTPSGTYALDVAGQVHATSFPTSSDERFKDVSTVGIEGALDKICRLSGVRFHWNETYKKMGRARGSDTEEIGIIAQSLKREFPELVSSWSDGEETYYGVEYGRLAVVLLEAIKQLRGELCQMRKESLAS